MYSVHVEKLAEGMGLTGYFGNAHVDTGFVASEVVADPLAAPAVQEASRMLGGSVSLLGLWRLDQCFALFTGHFQPEWRSTVNMPTIRV